jgi:hypothetical protein
MNSRQSELLQVFARVRARRVLRAMASQNKNQPGGDDTKLASTRDPRSRSNDATR